MMISYNSYTQSLSISNHTKSNNASITYAKIVNKEKLYAFVDKAGVQLIQKGDIIAGAIAFFGIIANNFIILIFIQVFSDFQTYSLILHLHM